jgi:hypothetical protein
MAAVINFEVQFTPFTGDIQKPEVQTVPGKAFVYLNNVPIAEQDVEKKNVPVLFDNREIAAAVWVPVKSLGGLVRKGKNVVKIEFVPADANAAYQARLQWNEVTDSVRETAAPAAAPRRTAAAKGWKRRRVRAKRSSNANSPGLCNRAAVAQVSVGRLAQRRRQAEARRAGEGARRRVQAEVRLDLLRS